MGQGLRRAFAATKKSRGEKLTPQEETDFNAKTLAARQAGAVDHAAEVTRYERLAREARNQSTSAKPPEYYDQMAAKHRKLMSECSEKKVMKKKTNESAPVSGLAFLVESELEKAQVVIAAKSILDRLQKMAEELAKVEADDIMPILDSMRLTFGPELTDSFNDVTTAKIRATMEAVKDAKEGITHEVARLEGDVNGEEVSDMAMDTPPADDLGGDDLGAEDDMGDLDGEVPDLDTGVDAEPEAAAGGDDLDAAFDAAASDTTAAGRARKESVERNVKALSESRNPDRLVFETFRRTLKEAKASGSKDAAVKAAKAVAEAFAIDYYDVVAVVKEGKTFKDEKGKKDKNTDWQQARKDKKRDRPSDIDEAAFGGAEKAKPFGKRTPKPTDKVANNFDEIKAKAKKPVEEDASVGVMNLVKKKGATKPFSKPFKGPKIDKK